MDDLIISRLLISTKLHLEKNPKHNAPTCDGNTLFLYLDDTPTPKTNINFFLSYRTQARIWSPFYRFGYGNGLSHYVYLSI